MEYHFSIKHRWFHWVKMSREGLKSFDQTRAYVVFTLLIAAVAVRFQ